ncbi:MAG: hypothetical protein K2X66_13190 [Cyanobacteria bacterium]|nr:hypothetical protein [Cyanobacteriota bacterium]
MYKTLPFCSPPTETPQNSVALPIPKLAPIFRILIILFAVYTTCGSILKANADPGRVEWTNLDLNGQQQGEISRVESQWQKTYAELSPQIQRDKSELQKLLSAPQPNESRIKELQKRIQVNEQKLRDEATRTFLTKKGTLTPNQKVRLQQMIGE